MELSQILRQKQYWKILFLFVIISIVLLFKVDIHEKKDVSVSYEQFISKVYSSGDRLSSFSIFKKDTITSKKIELTEKAYELVRNTVVKEGKYDALNVLLNDKYLICLSFAFVFLFINLILDTEELTMRRLLFALPAGRTKYVCKKAVALFVSIFVFLICEEMVMVCFGIIKYGAIDGFQNPVQSVLSLSKCILPISVAEYLFLIFLLKLLGLFVVGLFLYVIRLLCKSNIVSFGISTGIIVVEYLFWNISEQSRFLALKYLNIWNLIAPGNVLQGYDVISIRGILFGSIDAFFVFELCFLAMSIAMAVVTANRYPVSKKKLALSKILGKGNELFKIFVEQKGYLAIIIVGIILFIIVDTRSFTYTGSAQWSQTVYDEYKGQDLEKIGEFLQTEQGKMEIVVEEYENSVIAFEKGEMAKKEYLKYETAMTNTKAKRDGLKVVTAYYEYLLKMREKGIKADFINYKPYKLLWGGNGLSADAKYHNQELYSLLAIMIVMLLIGNLFSHDKDIGMDCLIKTLPKGRLWIFRKREMMMVLFCLCSCVGVYGVEYYQVSQLCTFDNWTSCVQSIVILKDIPLQLPIWLYFFLVELGHIGVLVLICWLEIFMCRKIGSNKGMIVSNLLVVGPEILHYFGIGVFEWASLAQIMQITERITRHGIGIYLLSLCMLLIVSCICRNQVKKEFGR